MVWDVMVNRSFYRRRLRKSQSISAHPLVAVVIATMFLVAQTEARRIRVATFNVEVGVGAPGSAKYHAIRNILYRMDSDIVAFQELTSGTSNAWGLLAEDLGYPYRAAAALGPFSGDTWVGVFSRFPIIQQHEVRGPPEACEIARFPLCVIVSVPGAARPLIVWIVHHKARFGYADNFRRAVEARRVVEDIEAHLARFTNHVEYVVAGDMNDDFEREDQPASYSALPRRLPANYRLGSDIRFPLRYRVFPHDHYASAGIGMRWVPAFRCATDNRKTHLHTDYTLDYVYVSVPFWTHRDGPPRAEILYSGNDREDVGLPKRGAALPPDLSSQASDHYPVFVDLNMEDTAGR